MKTGRSRYFIFWTFFGRQIRWLAMRSSCKVRREQWTCVAGCILVLSGRLVSSVEVWKRFCLDFCALLCPTMGSSCRVGEDVSASAAVEIGCGHCLDCHIFLCPGFRRAEVVEEIVNGLGRIGDWIGADLWEAMRGSGCLHQGEAFRQPSFGRHKAGNCPFPLHVEADFSGG